jgi:hypothetical protein
MEYANYANALAQDKDFWINTIKPILRVFEDAFNKQLIWPIFGSDVCIRFDLDSVPAIKGDQTAIEERLLKLKKEGIVSARYVREQLSIDETAAPEEKSNDAPVEGDIEEQPDKEEREAVENAVFHVLKSHRNTVLQNADKITCNGAIMSVLCDPTSQAPRMYNLVSANKSMRNGLKPVLREVLVSRGLRRFNDRKLGVFTTEHADVEALLRRVDFQIETAVDQNIAILRSILADADKYDWTYAQLVRRMKRAFSYERSQQISDSLYRAFYADLTSTLNGMEQSIQHTVISTGVFTE